MRKNGDNCIKKLPFGEKILQYYNGLWVLTLKVPVMTAADDSLEYFSSFFVIK